MKKILYNLFIVLGVLWTIGVLSFVSYEGITNFGKYQDKIISFLRQESSQSNGSLKVLSEETPDLNILVDRANANGHFYSAYFTSEDYTASPYSLEEWNALAEQKNCPNFIPGGSGYVGDEPCQTLYEGQIFEQTNFQFLALNNYVLYRPRNSASMVIRWPESNGVGYDVYEIRLSEQFSDNENKKTVYITPYPITKYSAQRNQEIIDRQKEVFSLLDLDPNQVDTFYPLYENVD